MPGGLAEGLWENESETENPFKRVRMETVLRALSDKPWTLSTLPKSHINVVLQDLPWRREGGMKRMALATRNGTHRASHRAKIDVGPTE